VISYKRFGQGCGFDPSTRLREIKLTVNKPQSGDALLSFVVIRHRYQSSSFCKEKIESTSQKHHPKPKEKT
jgi:hypothetical protein